MKNTISQIVNTPWKIGEELKMYVCNIFGYIYLVIYKGARLGSGYKFYGLPKIFRHRESSIKIGDRFENRNTRFSNPLGVNHPTIICTWSKNSTIEIGSDVGISGGSIVSSKKIEIGKGTLIGTNCLIIDSDFHPLKSKNRRHEKKDIKSATIKIGENVFIGTGCTILKGVTIPDNTVVPAGKVVRSGDY